ncbi:unnamed protein product, partial [Didymodactylos carnosus]
FGRSRISRYLSKIDEDQQNTTVQSVENEQQYRRQTEIIPTHITQTSDITNTGRPVSEYTEQSSTTTRATEDSERRITEIHTAPAARVTDRISRFDTDDQQQQSQRGTFLTMQTIDTRRQMYEDIGKQTTPYTSIDVEVREKQPLRYHSQTGMISSIDSDVSVGGPSSPPKYHSTPKSKVNLDLYKNPDGNESEDELSEREQQRTTIVTGITSSMKQRNLRDISSSTQDQATTFNETNMENLLSHVPISKGKGLLIELSPHVSDTQPTKSYLKPISSDSGIFEYSTATSIGRPSSQFLSDNAANIRDSGIYVDQTSASSRSRRLHTSDTDLTSSEYGQHQQQIEIDKGLSKSTYRYETDILQPKQPVRATDEQRNVRRHIKGSFSTLDTSTTPGTLSDYDNLANYRSGSTNAITTARIPTKQVPITTQSRAKPVILNEIETIETETHVQFEMNRTREIKESTKTELAPKVGSKTTKITTTSTNTTRIPDSLSDETMKTSKRVLLNEKPQYYNDQSKISRISPETYISSRPITTEIRQTYKESGTHRFGLPTSETVIHETRRHPLSQSSEIVQEHSSQQEEPVRIEETWFKPIQRDRSHDNLVTVSTSERQRHYPQRSAVRTSSAGPHSMQVTSLSSDSQVTFGKYDSNEIIAIVRVPEMNQQQNLTLPTTVALPSTQIDHNVHTSIQLQPTIRQTSMSEPELYTRVRQEVEQQQSSPKHLQQQQLVTTSYIPTAEKQNRTTYEHLQTSHQNDVKRDLRFVDQETKSSIISGEPTSGRRSRMDPYDITNEYSHITPPLSPPRSLSYHSTIHEQQQYPTSSSNLRPHSLQSHHRSGSLGNLFGQNLEFEIEIEKRPPNQPERPTVVKMDQATNAIVTTSKDGRVSVQNVVARPGNTVVINSDFHSSDRSLNRSSGYFSSDELRSQGVNTNYSSDEQSGASNNPPSLSTNIHQQGQKQQTHIRRYNAKSTLTSGADNYGNLTTNMASRLPSHYRSNVDNVEKINQILNQFDNGSGTTSASTPGNTTTGFTDAIAQIDALYNNLDIDNDPLNKTDTRERYLPNRQGTATMNENYNIATSPTPKISTSTYDFNKSSKEQYGQRLAQPNHVDLTEKRSNNSNTMRNSPDSIGHQRYSSTGFQHIPNEHDTLTKGLNSMVPLIHASSSSSSLNAPFSRSSNSTLQYLIAPPSHLASSSYNSPSHIYQQKQYRHLHNEDDNQRSYSQTDLRPSSFEYKSQNENSNNNNNNINSEQSLWQSNTLKTSLNNSLVVNNQTITPIYSRSLSSSGIVADHGSSPTNYYSSSSTSQPFILQQNRTNQQQQQVHRNRTSVKMVKQKDAAKKRVSLDNQEIYSEDEDSGDSPLSDNDRHQHFNEMTNTTAFNHLNNNRQQ